MKKNSFSNKPYRILQVIGTSLLAGTEKAMVSLVKGMDKDLFQTEVVCFSKGPLVQELSVNKIRTTIIPRRRKIDLNLLLRLFCFLKRNRFSLIHVHSDRIASFAAKLAGIRIIVETRHGIGYLPEEMNRWKFFLYKLASNPSTKIIAVAESVKADLIKQARIDPERIEVIYNGINIEPVSSEYQPNVLGSLGLPKDGYSLVATFGRFEPIKGHRYVLESAKEVLKFFPHTIFLIVGDGPMRKNLEELTQFLDIRENVVFTGWQKNVLAIMRYTDIVILPSLREGLSITGLEALSLGKPIIATSVGGNPEIVQHGSNGLLVPPKDSKELAKAIISLLASSDLIEKYGKVSRKLVAERFSEEIMVQKVQDLYLRLLKG